MMRQFVACACVIVAIASNAAAVYGRDDVTIVDAKFTSAVRDREPVDTLVSPHPKAPLTLWTRMSATKEALVRLQKDGRLPIRHRWTRFIAGMGELNSGTMTDDISGEIGSSAFLTAIERELATRSFFDWRFWSEKRNVAIGHWQVEVVYANGDPVMCRQQDQAARPCKFLMEVR